MIKRGLGTAAVVGLLAAGWLGAQIKPEVRRRAETVIAALERIEAEQSLPSGSPGRSYDVSEAELNAFIAYQIETQNEPYVKYVEIRLLARNRIEGRLLLDLGGRGGLPFLPAKAELLFSAGVETAGGRIRITMDDLFLGTQRLQPSLIDTVIAVVSRLEGVEPTSLRDWYGLPYGIQRMETRPGRLTLVF
jgi:hypothetical protein